MKRYYLIFVFSIISGICYSQISKPVTIGITKADLKRNLSPMSALIDEISYIPLETRTDVIIGAASQYHLIRMQDCFCIYHSRCNEALMLFEEDGRFRCRVGGIGQGPEEYSGVFSVSFDKYLNRILVLQSSQVKQFDLEGNYISTVNIPFTNARIRRMAIVDGSHWMFTFLKGTSDNDIEAGVIKTDKDGKLIKEFREFDSSIPGCNSQYAISNMIYNSGINVCFCPYDYNKTYMYNDKGWVLSHIVEDPFKKPPRALYNASRSALMDFKIENGFIMSSMIYFDKMIVECSTPNSYNIIVDLKDGNKYISSYSMGFHMEGHQNDIDGGMPFKISSIDDEGYSYELIDSPKLIQFNNSGLLNPDGKSYGEFSNLKELLGNIKMNDNPVIVVSHIKNN